MGNGEWGMGMGMGNWAWDMGPGALVTGNW
jgi:hypothetical protein